MDAAIYCRISHVNDDSTIGVDRQEQDGRALAERRGWTVSAVHIDNNRSAWRRNRKRPGWDALLEDIRERRVDQVIVAHPDRLIRQPRDLEDLLDISRDTGVQLHSAGGSRDLAKPDDVFILRVEVAHACRSSDDTSRRVSRGHEAAAMAGRPGGGTGRYRPYGYTDDQLEALPSEAAVVVECAQRVLSGESTGSIVQDLNTRQVPTVSGRPWNRTSLTGILTSPRTAGLRERRGEILGPAVWPPLLDMPTWDAVREILTRPAPPGLNRRRHLLSGLVRCAHCPGQRLGVRTGNPPGYACPNCDQRVARHLLDEHVITEVLTRLDQARIAERIADPVSADDAEDRQAITEAERGIERALDTAWGEADSPTLRAVLRKKVARYETEIENARRRMASRARRTAITGLAGIGRPEWDVLPLTVRRAVVAEVLPDLTVERTTRRGRGMDPGRVRFDG